MAPLMHYRPWIGDDYKDGLRSGLKLLILGHSHYGDENPDATEKYTKEHIEQKPGVFWTHVEQVILGQRLDKDRRRTFWNSVAFSNFIQEPLEQPGDEPTDSQWNQARRAFPEIIAYTRPDVMFVFSTTAWSKLPDDREGEYPGSFDVPGCCEWAYLYRVDSTYQLFAGAFAHPRNAGAERRIIWHAWSEFLFTKALSIIKNIETQPIEIFKGPATPQSELIARSSLSSLNATPLASRSSPTRPR